MSTLVELKRSWDEEFDGDQYLEKMMNPEKKFFALNRDHLIDVKEAFTSQNVSGGKLLEVGCGPYVGNAIICSQFFDEVYLSEYSESMVTPLRKWINGGGTKFDYTGVIKECARILGKTSHEEELVAETRRKTKRVMKCDVHLPSVIEDKTKFDWVITRMAIESSPDIENYLQAVANTLGSVKVGGFYLQMGFLSLLDTAYKRTYAFRSDGTDTVAMNPTKEDVINTLEANNMKVLDWKVHNYEWHEDAVYPFDPITFTVLAVKQA